MPGNEPQRGSLFFDADDTLFSLKEHPGKTYARILKGAGIEVGSQELEERVLKVWNDNESFYLKRGRSGRVDAAADRSFWFQFVRQVLRPYCNESVIKAVFPELYLSFSRPEGRRVNTELQKLITTLFEHNFRIAVFSNCDERIVSIIRHHFPEIAVPDILTAASLGYKKPYLIAFDILKTMYEGPHYYIGNSRELDVQPAQRAGWTSTTLWSQDGKSFDQGILNLLA